jgi:ribosomal protein L7/L12
MDTEQEIADLKRRITLLEQQVSYLLSEFSEAAPGAPIVDPEVVALARQGKLLDAIKVYRAQTGASLEEARSVVNSLR